MGTIKLAILPEKDYLNIKKKDNVNKHKRKKYLNTCIFLKMMRSYQLFAQFYKI